MPFYEVDEIPKHLGYMRHMIENEPEPDISSENSRHDFCVCINECETIEDMKNVIDAFFNPFTQIWKA